MAFDARVYRVLIASPSDVEDERQIAADAIREWNDLHSYSRRAALMPLLWETHASPEYGSRPQEAINRQIVDESDLVVGIFWTRIGSPTGEAESGTLEEIQRAAVSGKPIMLYFSQVPIDPYEIDMDQKEKLRQFRKDVQTNALVETYHSTLEFRDKFSKHLERNMRELEQKNSAGESPLALRLLDLESAEPAGATASHKVSIPEPSEIPVLSDEKKKKLHRQLTTHIRRQCAVPIPLVLENHGMAGIRNVFVEVEFEGEAEAIEVLDDTSVDLDRLTDFFRNYRGPESDHADAARRLASRLSRFESNELHRTKNGWHLAVEWEAIQPKRVRLVRPLLFVLPRKSSTLQVRVNVYSDTFAQPLHMEASVDFEVTRTELSLNEIMPEWKEKLEEQSLSERLLTSIGTGPNKAKLQSR